MKKTLIIFSLIWTFTSSTYADGPIYWTVKLNDSILFDSRSKSKFVDLIPDYQDYQFIIKKKDIKRTDTLLIEWHEGEIWIDKIYNFVVTDSYYENNYIVGNGLVTEQIKCITSPKCAIPLKSFCKGMKVNSIRKVSFYREGETEVRNLCSIIIK